MAQEDHMVVREETRGRPMPADRALLHEKAAAFLKSYRDDGAGEIGIGPFERLSKSLGLTAGDDIAPSELDMWIEQLALDPWARGLSWETDPAPGQREGFSVVVIGAGAGGLGAAVQLGRAGIPHVVVEKNSGVGGTWF